MKKHENGKEKGKEPSRARNQHGEKPNAMII
jgi:hypothetical protein